jgi:S-adenosylmethionine decarboxylase
MWGKHLVLDCSSCDREAVRSPDAIRAFSEDLVSSIGMVAYGEPVLAPFATHLPEATGYSLVQLIETSAVTGHFCDASGDAYLDVFSCKDFDAQVAILHES